MGRSWRAVVAALALNLGVPTVVLAGMPAVTLSDIARMRVQNMSFFVAALLVSSWVVKAIWNSLRRDFTFLPYLSYKKALGVMVLWGLLFVLVLTMISGARELMTPGAWEKQGATYRLVTSPVVTSPEAPASPGEEAQKRRRDKLEELRTALWDYARAHEQQFPPEHSTTDIPEEKWQVPDGSGMRYLYVPGLKPNGSATPLVFEPEMDGPRRYVLFTNGEIRRISLEEVLLALPKGNP